MSFQHESIYSIEEGTVIAYVSLRNTGRRPFLWLCVPNKTGKKVESICLISTYIIDKGKSKIKFWACCCSLSIKLEENRMQ